MIEMSKIRENKQTNQQREMHARNKRANQLRQLSIQEPYMNVK
jgi:hypothetical protein